MNRRLLGYDLELNNIQEMRSLDTNNREGFIVKVKSIERCFQLVPATQLVTSIVESSSDPTLVWKVVESSSKLANHTAKIIDNLTDAEKKILRKRFGIPDDEPIK